MRQLFTIMMAVCLAHFTAKGEVYEPAIASESEVSVFFEADNTVTEGPRIWVWKGDNGGEAYLGNGWGERPYMKLMGNTADGNSIYKWTYKGVLEAPDGMVITWNNDDNTRIETSFTNHGYYKMKVLESTVTNIAEDSGEDDGQGGESLTPADGNNHIIYQMNLYNFTSEGTLAAAQKRLASLHDLGIDIVWIMPIHPRGNEGRIGKLGSPYAPKDYYAVNSDHGTLADLQNFVDAAHELGMQVWLDWVANHTAKDAVWVTEHPEYYKTSGSSMVSPNGYGDVYQLKMSSTTVQNAMIDAMQYWVTNADIDGFRCDFVSSNDIPTAFWTNAISALKNQDNGKQVSIMAEGDLTDVTRLFGCGWDYDYAWGFQTKLTKVGTSATNLKTACQNLVGDTRFKGSLSRMVYLANHDQNYDKTMNDQYGSNVYSLTALMFTIYGMPLLYDGQENGYLINNKLDYFNKNLINWSYSDAKMANTVKVLARLKRTEPALVDNENRSSVQFLNSSSSANTMAYVRKNGSSEVLTVINLKGSPVTTTISGINAGEWKQVVNSNTISTSTEPTTVTLSSSADIKLASYGYAVYVRNAGSTPVSNIEADETADASVYDLAGRKIADKLDKTALQRGVYICGGRKIIVK